MKTQLLSLLVCLSILAPLTAGDLDALYRLGRGKGLVHLDEIELDFDVFHPQGLAHHEGLFYLSTVEVLEQPVSLEGGAWTPGKGRGHLLVFNSHGELLDDLSLGKGDRFHPGGISSDGVRLWIPVAEYRPGSHTIVYTLDLGTRKLRRAFDFADHLSALAAAPGKRVLFGYDWDSRNRFTFSPTGRLLATQPVTDGWIAYQSVVVLPDGNLLGSGTRVHRFAVEGSVRNGRIGGMSIETAAGRLRASFPVPHFTEAGNPLTRNAFTLVWGRGGPRFYFLPDSGAGNLLVYAPEGWTQDIGPEVPPSGR